MKRNADHAEKLRAKVLAEWVATCADFQNAGEEIIARYNEKVAREFSMSRLFIHASAYFYLKKTLPAGFDDISLRNCAARLALGFARACEDENKNQP